MWFTNSILFVCIDKAILLYAVLHPLCSIQSHPITNKRFPKNSSYISSENYMPKHTFIRHIHNFSSCWVNTIQKYIVPRNKPAKLCVLCNKFFSLFMLNAAAEYLLNTHVVLYSFILPYICYICTPQFVNEKLKFFHYVGILSKLDTH